MEGQRSKSQKKHKIRLPAPTLSTTYESRFKSFLQDHISPSHSYGDEGQPTKIAKVFGRYEICPNYSFTSKTEKVSFTTDKQ